MRIEPLTDAVAGRILAARRRSDPAADRVVARIIADVRKRGDAALFAWALRLDKARLTRRTLWIDAAQRLNTKRQVPRELLRAVERAARNIRRVAEQQRPRSWAVAVEPGVRVGQRVIPLDTIGCY